MHIDCPLLSEMLRASSLVRDCDVLDEETLRISTLFQYPDRSYIDLFLEQMIGLHGSRTESLFKGHILSDLGETVARLVDLQVKPWATKKRQKIVSAICESLDVEHERGQLQIKLETTELADLPSAAIRLGQACIRVADLSLTQRPPRSGDFKTKVETFIKQTGLPYDRRIPVLGRFGKEVQVDFRVQGQTSSSLVKTFSSADAGGIHKAMIEIFRCWYDLALLRGEVRLVTILDSQTHVFRGDDLARLATQSDVFIYPAQEGMLRSTLAA